MTTVIENRKGYVFFNIVPRAFFAFLMFGRCEKEAFLALSKHQIRI